LRQALRSSGIFEPATETSSQGERAIFHYEFDREFGSRYSHYESLIELSSKLRTETSGRIRSLLALSAQKATKPHTPVGEVLFAFAHHLEKYFRYLGFRDVKSASDDARRDFAAGASSRGYHCDRRITIKAMRSV
jgi:hypothetical protein